MKDNCPFWTLNLTRAHIWMKSDEQNWLENWISASLRSKFGFKINARKSRRKIWKKFEIIQTRQLRLGVKIRMSSLANEPELFEDTTVTSRSNHTMWPQSAFSTTFLDKDNFCVKSLCIFSNSTFETTQFYLLLTVSNSCQQKSLIMCWLKPWEVPEFFSTPTKVQKLPQKKSMVIFHFTTQIWKSDNCYKDCRAVKKIEKYI